MALDINNIKPASIKSKNVATEQYVDTSIAGIDISNTLNTNNDLFAQRLGYLSYADMVAAATNGKTIINGGYLRGELIEANSINAGQIDAYAITGKQITGGTINGTDINGVRITGAIIKASFIDYTSNLALSNWQYYTPATIPPTYAANFAHHNDGSLLVDSQGYVRLPAQSGFKTTGTVKTIGGNFYGVNATYNATHNEVFNIYSYDDYTINTLNRVIFPDVNTSFLSGEFKIVTTCGIQFDKYIDGSFNYYDFNISFLGDTIQGYAYINTNSSGPSSNSHWSVNGGDVGSTYTKTKKGITYTLTVIPEAVMGYYMYKGRPIGELQQMGHSFVFTITADFSENKTILGYTQGDLIQLINSNGLMNASPDDATNPAYGIFKHDLKYPVLNVQ